jgi:hypothetical protein
LEHNYFRLFHKAEKCHSTITIGRCGIGITTLFRSGAYDATQLIGVDIMSFPDLSWGGREHDEQPKMGQLLIRTSLKA